MQTKRVGANIIGGGEGINAIGKVIVLVAVAYRHKVVIGIAQLKRYTSLGVNIYSCVVRIARCHALHSKGGLTRISAACIGQSEGVIGGVLQAYIVGNGERGSYNAQSIGIGVACGSSRLGGCAVAEVPCISKAATFGVGGVSAAKIDGQGNNAAVYIGSDLRGGGQIDANSIVGGNTGIAAAKPNFIYAAIINIVAQINGNAAYYIGLVAALG